MIFKKKNESNNPYGVHIIDGKDKEGYAKTSKSESDEKVDSTFKLNDPIYIGVTLSKDSNYSSGTYVANCYHNGIIYCLGNYDTIDEAKKVYNNFVEKNNLDLLKM